MQIPQMFMVLWAMLARMWTGRQEALPEHDRRNKHRTKAKQTNPRLRGLYYRTKWRHPQSPITAISSRHRMNEARRTADGLTYGNSVPVVGSMRGSEWIRENRRRRSAGLPQLRAA